LLPFVVASLFHVIILRYHNTRLFAIKF
jgi:hypothetical protein